MAETVRPLAVALALLLPLLATPGAAAEEPALSDPEGDVVFTTGGPSGALPDVPAGASENAKASDLLALRASETDDSMFLTAQVASLAANGASTSVRIHFGWAGGDFELQLGFFRDPFGGEQAFGALLKRDGDDREFVASMAPLVDATAGTLAAEVPKVYLVSADNRIPGRGDVIELRFVEAGGGAVMFPFAGVRSYDRMPDADGAPVLLTLALGDFAQGNVILHSADRVRVSNGGATTFVFQTTIRNTAALDDEFVLSIADAPEGWNATVRSPVKVPANGERTLGVLVSVPFAHDHGGYSSFNLTAQSARDPATQARMRMGILHTPIPQPAGHHPDLYLHAGGREFGGQLAPVIDAAFPSASGWMNTDADHTEDDAYATPYTYDGVAEWWIPLSPSLQLGLDFDLERKGELTASILGKRNGETPLRATLYHEVGSGDDALRTTLAESDETTIALNAQAATPFTLTFTPTAESDYIAYQPDARMVLVLTIEGMPTDDVRFSSTLQPQLMVEDFVLSLPLNEYHDRLTGAAEATEAIEIVANGPVEKAGLPGSVMTYAFTVRNGGAPDTFVIDLAGNDAHEGVVVPRGAITLDTGESLDVTVAVEIPIHANADQEFEVLLFVHALEDPSKMAIARTKTRATLSGDQAAADETHLLLEAQARGSDVPGLGLAALAASLGLVALARSKRRA